MTFQRGEATGVIPELEGLRGLLALWVVFGHWATSIQLSFRPLRQNLWDVQAVDVFIILSGFVITLLLSRSETSYRGYLVRRWFRIAPAYIVVLLVSAILFPAISALRELTPPGEMEAVRVAIQTATQQNFTTHVILHILLLHGLAPTATLPYAAYSLVGQAWSISLEWQFYILAPLFYSLVLQWRRRTALLALAALCGGLMLAGMYFSPAFLGNKLPLFALGAASFWLWRRVTTAGKLPVPLASLRWLSAGAVVLCLAPRLDALLGPALWLVVMHCLLVARTTPASPEGRLASLLRLPPVLFLGRISYSLYLVHFLVMLSGMALLVQLTLGAPAYAGLLLLYVVPMSIVAASVMYRWVEQPGIALGRRLSNLLRL